MRDLAVLVPSRARPHNIARLLDAMDATCRADTHLVLGIDDDDPARDQYLAFSDVEVIVQPRQRLVEWLNYLAVPRAREFRYLGHIGDDNVPHTVGWDTRVIESLKRQRTGVCFADDLDPGRQPGSLSIHAFMSANIVRKLGYMGPPQIQHMYVDPVWFAWGTATSMEFLADVVIEHRHYSIQGKAPMDDSYAASTALIPSDCANYNAYCNEQLNVDVRKLGGHPFTDAELAEFNRKLNIPAAWPA